MGLGPSKIDYKERDFTKQPLEDEEIDILLEALPEDSIIGSLDSEDREEIVSTINSEKLFNLKGDSIFDYYFANNKEAIKGCMNNSINPNKFYLKDFGKASKELTVKECKEYAEENNIKWGGEKTDWGNFPVGCAYYKYPGYEQSHGVYYLNVDTREEHDCGIAYTSCVEKNPISTPCPDEKFNRMITRIPDLVQGPLREKETEWDTERSGLQTKYDTLNTSKTNLQTQYDTLEQEKTKLQTQYETLFDKISHHKVIDSGRIVDNITEEECKQLYEVQLGKDFISVPNTDRPKGCYKSGSHYRYAKNGHLQCGKGNDDCIITKPPWTKFRQDMLDHGVGLRNASGDTDTLSFNKEKFGYLISVLPAKASNWREIKAKGSSWDIGTSVYIFQDAYKHKSFPWFNIYKKMEKYQVGKFTKISFGSSVEGVSEKECKDYAYRTGLKWFGAPGNWTDRPKGCVLHKSTDRVFYNLKDNNKKCSRAFNCIHNSEKYNRKQCGGNKGGTYDCRVGAGWSDVVVPGWSRNKYGGNFDAAKHFCNNSEACVAVASAHASWNWPVHTTSKFRPCNKVEEVTSGSPGEGTPLTKEECQKWAESKGKTMEQGTDTSGCYAAPKSNGYGIYYNEVPNKGSCYYTNDSNYRKCLKSGIVCNPHINYYTKDVLPEYYKVTGSGVCDKPEDIVPEDECKQAASALKYKPTEAHFGQKGEHAQSGCFMDGTKLFHFDNKWKGANYKKVGTYGGRTYLCKKSTKCVGSKDKNEPYYHDNLNNPGCCDGLKPFEHNGVKYCKKYD